MDNIAGILDRELNRVFVLTGDRTALNTSDFQSHLDHDPIIYRVNILNVFITKRPDA